MIFKYKFIFNLVGLLALLVVSSCNKEDICEETIWYQDADEDGFGDPDVSIDSCVQPTGYVQNNTDDDDSSAYHTVMRLVNF